jgi:hypothetical protein
MQCRQGGSRESRLGVFDITNQCRWATLSDKLLGKYALDIIEALMLIVHWCNSRSLYGGRISQFAICPVCALQHRVSKIYRECRHASLTFPNINLPSYQCSLKFHCTRQHLFEGSFDCNRCGSHQASADGLVAHWKCKHRDWYLGINHGMKERLMNSSRANSESASIQDFALARSHVLVYLGDSHNHCSQWLVAFSSCLVNMGWPPENIALALAMLKRHEPFSQPISLHENTVLIAHWALELIPRWPHHQNHQMAVTEMKLKTLGERLCNQGFPFGRVYPTENSRRIQNKKLVDPHDKVNCPEWLLPKGSAC